MTSHQLAYIPSQAHHEPTTVDATQVAPGLYVYELPEHIANGINSSVYRWRIGHHSGVALLIADTETDALNGARAIAELTDWTVDKTTLQTALSGAGFKAMHSKSRRHHCHPAGY